MIWGRGRRCPNRLPENVAALAAEAQPEAASAAGVWPGGRDWCPGTARRPAAHGPELPPYTRSLLHIRVPVVVTLARKRQALGRIVELGPGSIIQFDKSCEEMLELSVGDHPIASGEAVKVGDKFGLRHRSRSPCPANDSRRSRPANGRERMPGASALVITRHAPSRRSIQGEGRLLFLWLHRRPAG